VSSREVTGVEPQGPAATNATGATGALGALDALDRIEDGLVARFRRHPVLVGLARLRDEELTAILLQRRFVSLAFTPAYDLAIDLLQDAASLRIARVILREEYPDGSGHTRSHREDLKDDLLRLGVTRRALVESAPTATTRRAIGDTFALIADAGRRDDADLRLVTLLRFWGEILVSVEYAHMWERMAPLLTGGDENRSRFYYPHLVHDAKAHPLANVSLLSSTHSDRLATRLHELLARAPSTAAFEEVEEQALHLKESFYDQFLPLLPGGGG
jgi:hypothetical protein